MNPQLKKAKRWFGRVAILVAVIAILVALLPKFPPSWQTSWFAKTTTSQEKPSQYPCSYRYVSASMKRIVVVLPASGALSEEVIFTAPAGKCYWFEGPQGTEVWFSDGTHGLITEQYPPKIPRLRFSNPSGGILNIAIER